MADSDSKAVQELIQISRDSADFYESARDDIGNPVLKDIFTRMASAKRGLIQSLGARLVLRGEEIPDSGTVAGSLRKSWAGIRASLGGKNEAIYVAQLEETEDRLLEHFNEALQTLEDPRTRETLAAELPQVRACHDEMRALKRRLAA